MPRFEQYPLAESLPENAILLFADPNDLENGNPKVKRFPVAYLEQDPPLPPSPPPPIPDPPDVNQIQVFSRAPIGFIDAQNLNGANATNVQILSFYRTDVINEVRNLTNGQTITAKCQADKELVFVNGTNFSVPNGYLLVGSDTLVTITRSGSNVTVTGTSVTYPDKALLVDFQLGHGNSVAQAFKNNFPGWENTLVLGMPLYNPYTQFSGLIQYAIAAQMKSAFVPYAIPPNDIAGDFLGEAAWNRGCHIIQATSNGIGFNSPPNAPVYSIIMTSGPTADIATRARSLGMDFWDVEVSNSPATGVIAAKMLQVFLGRNDGVWAARYAARITAIRTATTHPNGELWNSRCGFGRIDVAAAIAFSGTIPPDPYLNAGNVYTPFIP